MADVDRQSTDYSSLFPKHSVTRKSGTISRKTASAIAKLYADAFTFEVEGYHEVKKSDLYDFLYEHNYPGWFSKDSQRMMDRRSLELWVMDLHTGETLANLFEHLTSEQQQSLGQAYLRKLAEDVLLLYEELFDEYHAGGANPPVGWEDYPEGLKNVYRRLELDGYVFREFRLLVSEGEVLEKEEEHGILESLYTQLALGEEETAFNHLELSEEHYLAGRWSDSIHNSRSFLEAVLREVSTAHNIQRNGTPLSNSVYTRPVKVRQYLEKEGIIDIKEREALDKVYGLLSSTGGHPYMARDDQARLLRNVALVFSQFILLRFQGTLAT